MDHFPKFIPVYSNFPREVMIPKADWSQSVTMCSSGPPLFLCVMPRWEDLETPFWDKQTLTHSYAPGCNRYLSASVPIIIWKSEKGLRKRKRLCNWQYIRDDDEVCIYIYIYRLKMLLSVTKNFLRKRWKSGSSSNDLKHIETLHLIL